MITNTTKRAQENPFGTLIDLVEINNPIESQEAQGQIELVNSDLLPTEVFGKGRETLEKAGVVFGEPLATDPMFSPVELPFGWKKVPTNHSMWSNLVDDKGNVVAGIFYKAAFYDRRAFVRVDLGKEES